MLQAAIPSPSVDAIDVGPLSFNLYGMAIALGAYLAVVIAQRRWAARGGDPADVVAIVTWALPAGLIGARAYHVLTDWDRFEGRRHEVLFLWEGGLGIPGGLLAGTVVGVLVVRRRGLPVADLLDVAAPALPVAQAVGRLGNWFNQELYGRATDLPWALRIDPEHRPAGMEDVATYHPTFLYEGLWNLALAGLLVLVDRRRVLRPGNLFVGYVLGYALGRLWVEALRIDPATTIAGLRVNTWVSLVVAAVALVVLARRQRRAPVEQRSS